MNDTNKRVIMAIFAIGMCVLTIAPALAGLPYCIEGYIWYSDGTTPCNGSDITEFTITNINTNWWWNRSCGYNVTGSITCGVASSHILTADNENYYFLVLDDPDQWVSGNEMQFNVTILAGTNTTTVIYTGDDIWHNITLPFPAPTDTGIANHVVISEVQVEGVTANDEFVELYNPTNGQISLSGWYLTKKTSGGTEQNLLAGIPAGKSIPARGFFLITPQTGYTGSTISDANYSQTSNFIAADNTVILYNESKTAVIDKVGFGNAIDNETLSYLTNPADSESLQRKVNATLNESGSYGPAWDTDNNSADFFIQVNPNPQNSSAEPVPPIPELSTLILLSSGLIVLVGYLLLKRRAE